MTVAELAETPTPSAAPRGEALRRRAARGVGVLGLQTVVVKGALFASNIVLARLLVPRDFGLVAFGTALVAVAVVLADGGIGVGLIRSGTEPDRFDLGTMLGFQLATTSVLAGITIAVGLTLGEVGRVTALIALTLPLASWSAPGAIVLERRLGYGSVARIESVATAAYVVWAIVSVALGAGVWGLASAMVLRPIVRDIATLVAVPEARVRPRLRLDRLRPMLRFGSLFQASSLVDLGRDQAINSGTLAITGLGTLGLWTLAGNLAQIPFSLLEVLTRVSLPTMARLIEVGDDPAGELEGAMQAVAVPLGLLSAGLVGTGPILVPLVFGEAWRGVIPVLPWIALAVVLTAPVNVVLGGYLCARNRPGVLLWANVVEVVVDLAVALPLLPLLGIQALGIGLVVGAVVDMPIFRSAVSPWSRTRVARPIVAPVLATGIASLGGWFAASALGATVLGLGASGALTAVLYLSVVAIGCRPALLRCIRAGLGALGRSESAGVLARASTQTAGRAVYRARGQHRRGQHRRRRTPTGRGRHGPGQPLRRGQPGRRGRYRRWAMTGSASVIG